MKMYAKVLADSITETGDRLVTVEATSPKYLDAECEKHRMLNTNSSSSRAIPVKRILEQVREDPFLPPDIRYNQGGMQGYDLLTEDHKSLIHSLLSDHADNVADFASELSVLHNVHKQHINRYIEAFSVQCKVITGNVESFRAMLKLRTDAHADPSIQDWAFKIQDAINKSVPNEVGEMEWHLPYVDGEWEDAPLHVRRVVSVSRCAAISYYRQDQENTFEQHLERYKRLYNSGHWSCFDHQAKPLLEAEEWPKGMTAMDREGRGCSGALKGWICLRNSIT